MRELGSRWWLIATLLVLSVIGASWTLYRGEVDHRLAVENSKERQAVYVLRQSVDDVLSREVALARVVAVLRAPIDNRWPDLAGVVTGQEVASSAALIVPVAERDRAAFERRTGLRLSESPAPGVVVAAKKRPLHLVVAEALSKSSARPTLGLDLAANPLRAHLMLAAAQTGRQLASPPVELLGRTLHRVGVIVYAPVRSPAGRLLGWVTATYQARPLAAMVTSQQPGTRLTIRDGANTLVGQIPHPRGAPTVLRVAGRRWEVWASAAVAGGFAVAWLVLGLGLALAAAFSLILRQTVTRERYALAILAQRDAEEAAIAEIATAVAEQSSPAEVFALVAHQVGQLLSSRTAAVSRFEPDQNQGVIVGSWTSDAEDLDGSTYALDGPTASAQTYRTAKPARTTEYASSRDPIASLMRRMGGAAGIAAPITVAGRLWGALGAAYTSPEIPNGAELSLERFVRLIGLAIANTAAWDDLAHQATTDALTGMPNRRAFDGRVLTEIARAQRYERSLSLAVMDIDHFKQINDRHGHEAGDRVLIVVAGLLTTTAREGELIARIGGEEFAWLMPETDEEGAFAAAERARRAIEAAAFPGLGSVSISVGVASAEAADTPETLVRRADEALYRAKKSGRNKTLTYREEARTALR